MSTTREDFKTNSAAHIDHMVALIADQLDRDRELCEFLGMPKYWALSVETESGYRRLIVEDITADPSRGYGPKVSVWALTADHENLLPGSKKDAVEKLIETRGYLRTLREAISFRSNRKGHFTS